MKKRKNDLGLWGWLGGGRWGLERYLYSAQRLSGVLLLLYLIAHVIVSGFRVNEPLWTEIMGALDRPWVHVLEFLLLVVVAFHGFNGLRLVLAELGLSLGRMRRPVYPYRTSLVRQRPLTLALMLMAVAFIVIISIEFFALPE